MSLGGHPRRVVRYCARDNATERRSARGQLVEQVEDHVDAGKVDAEILAERTDGSYPAQRRLTVDRLAAPLDLHHRRMRYEFLELPQSELIVGDSAQCAQRIAGQVRSLLAPRRT